MSWRAIRALIRKDLKVVLQSKAVTLPIIILPILLLVVMPAALTLPVLFAGDVPDSMSSDFDDIMSILPPALEEEFAGLAPEEIWVVYSLLYMFAPMFLIMPLMVTSVIGADSFVGEKERKTLEALLHSPLTDRELFTAKLLSAWLPGVAVALGSFVIYGVVVNALSWLILGQMIFPNAMWVALALWVCPAAAGLGLGVMVLISVRVSTFQDAYQLSGLVVIPVVALMLGQVAGVLYLSVVLVLLIGLLLWVIDAILLWFGIRTFQRGELIARL